MDQTHRHTSRGRASLAARHWGRAILFVTLVILITSAGCGASRKPSASSLANRSAALHRIAAAYAQDDNLDAARSAVAALKLANPGQVIVAQAEEEMKQGSDREAIWQLANLAQALGARSPQVIAYLAPTRSPTAAIPTVADPPLIPATAAPAATVPPTAAVAATDVATATDAATATLLPAAISTPTPAATSAPASTAAPAGPQAVASSSVNLRSGPGTAYPVIGQMAAGQSLAIMARNAGGDWWRVAYPSEEQAWVSGQVVDVSNADAVKVAQNIPAPPPTPIPAPTQPAAPQPTAAPAPTARPSTQYVIKDLHLKHVGVDAQGCFSGGDHNIWVYVIDAAGNRLDGVRVYEIWSKTTRVTGAQGKGAGTALWDIYRGGGGAMVVVDEGGSYLSPVTRGMSDDFPDADLLWDAGYCGCKPYPDLASCAAAVAARNAGSFPVGHFVYEVTFQRTY